MIVVSGMRLKCSQIGKLTQVISYAFHNTKRLVCTGLNGGKVESLHQDYEPMELAECGTIEWGVKSTFMKYSIEIRIKPKKEKRWIAVLPSGRVSGWHDEDREMLEEQYNKDAGWQIIEIEVDATAK